MDWKPSDVNHNDTEVGKGPATLGNYGMLMHVGSDMILILLQVSAISVAELMAYISKSLLSLGAVFCGSWSLQRVHHQKSGQFKNASDGPKYLDLIPNIR